MELNLQVSFYARYVLLLVLITYLSSGVLAKYSLSMSPSIRFLMITGDGKNRLFSCSVTSATKTLC